MKVLWRCMRMLVASGVLVLGVALLAVLSPNAAAASPAPSGAMIVCPLASPPVCCAPLPIASPGASARPGVVPCCPVPTSAGCCAPATTMPCCASVPCVPGLSITASPDPVSEGATTTISGALTGGTVAAQTVVLYERAAGQAAFSDVAQTQTDASGAYSFVRTVQTNADWYAKTGSVQSATVSQSVMATIALHPSHVHPKAGAKVVLTATVAPSHAGEQVELQRLQRGRWMTIARPKLNTESRFKVAEKIRGRKRVSFRVVLVADARNAFSVSGIVAIAPR